MVTDLHDHPLREIVWIGSLNQAMTKKIAMSVEVNGIKRDFFDQFRQLFFIIRLMGDTFL